MFLMCPHCTAALCVLSDYHLTLSALYWFYIPHIRPHVGKLNFIFPMLESTALAFTLSIDSPLTSCFQHFGIYIEAIRTSTRGLWTPIKLYFVQSSKWSDHKPSNRGINSRYWPGFQLRPAPMASFQNFEDRPLAQTFARLKKANEARRLFLFYKCEKMLDAFPGLSLVQTLWMLALIGASNVHWYVPCEPRIS